MKKINFIQHFKDYQYGVDRYNAMSFIKEANKSDLHDLIKRAEVRYGKMK